MPPCACIAAVPWTTLATKTASAASIPAPGVNVPDNAGTGAIVVTGSQTLAAQPERFLRITTELAGGSGRPAGRVTGIPVLRQQVARRRRKPLVRW